MLKCGLVGEKLGHSYSPAIHAALADYEYKLYELSREQLPEFIKNGDWNGLNVTIPYKKTVLSLCDELSERARRIGSVNTLVRRADGSIYGDNTDAYGFEALVRRSGIKIEGKKALVLGSGGASVAICAVLEDLKAGSITVISRGGEDNYDNISRHADADVIVNTTPVGMYPNTGVAAVDLQGFQKCSGVLDVVYNPARTALLLQAESMGIPCASGLYMLVAQAKRSSELFCAAQYDDSVIERITNELRRQMQNIVIIGMPGSGKSTVAAALGERLSRKVYEADELIAERAGMSIPEIFALEGEEGFRARETEVLSELGKLSGAVISTGGGCVTREENYPLLHQNGEIICLERDVEKLPKDGRPISQRSDLKELYERRLPMYRAFADATVDNNGALEQTLQKMCEVLG